MKLRCVKPGGYRGAISLAFGEVVDVESGLAAALLARSDWFEAVGGEALPAPEVNQGDSYEKSIPAPPRKKPYRGKGK